MRFTGRGQRAVRLHPLVTIRSIDTLDHPMVEVQTIMWHRACCNCGRSFLVVLAEGYPLSIIGRTLVDTMVNSNLRYLKGADGRHHWVNVCPICNHMHDETRLQRDLDDASHLSVLREPIHAELRCRLCNKTIDNVLTDELVCAGCLDRLDHLDMRALELEGLSATIDEVLMVRRVLSLSINRPLKEGTVPRDALDDALAFMDHRVSEMMRRKGELQAEMRISEPDTVLVVDDDLVPEPSVPIDVHGWLRSVRQDRPRAFVPWSAEEDIQLARMASSGMTARDMAMTLHRTEGEVADRSSQPCPTSPTVVGDGAGRTCASNGTRND